MPITVGMATEAHDIAQENDALCFVWWVALRDNDKSTMQVCLNVLDENDERMRVLRERAGV